MAFTINVVDIALVIFILVLAYLYFLFKEIRRLKEIESNFEKMFAREGKAIAKEEGALRNEIDLLRIEMKKLHQELLKLKRKLKR